jgi:hypothetical protein
VKSSTGSWPVARSTSTPLTSTWPPVAVDPTKQRPRVIADTRDQVAALNTAICDRPVAAGHVDDTTALTTDAGERVGPGDQVATLRNERDLAGVARALPDSGGHTAQQDSATPRPR